MFMIVFISVGISYPEGIWFNQRIYQIVSPLDKPDI